MKDTELATLQGWKANCSLQVATFAGVHGVLLAVKALRLPANEVTALESYSYLQLQLHANIPER